MNEKLRKEKQWFQFNLSGLVGLCVFLGLFIGVNCFPDFDIHDAREIYSDFYRLRFSVQLEFRKSSDEHHFGWPYAFYIEYGSRHSPRTGILPLAHNGMAPPMLDEIEPARSVWRLDAILPNIVLAVIASLVLSKLTERLLQLLNTSLRARQVQHASAVS